MEGSNDRGIMCSAGGIDPAQKIHSRGGTTWDDIYGTTWDDIYGTTWDDMNGRLLLQRRANNRVDSLASPEPGVCAYSP